MTTKAQLNQLFISERDEMIEHMESIAASSKRYGHPNDEIDADLDLASGWAYRLLEYFGTALKLTLDADCQGYELLFNEGLAEDLIPAIRANYLELYETSNQRGWKNQIHLKMQHHNIEEGPSNEVRTESHLFKARADVLLDIQSRYPLLCPDGRRKIRKPPANGNSVGALVTASVEPQRKVEDIGHQKSAAIAPTASTRELETASAASADIFEAPQPTDIQTIAQNIAPSVATPLPNSKSLAAKRTLAVTEFEAECDRLITNMGNEWEKSTASDVKALVRMFVSVLKEHSVTDSGEIEQFHIGMLRQHFNDIPTHWGKSPRLKSLSAPLLRLEGEKLRKEAALSGNDALVGLSAGTIRKHFANLQHFLKHLKGHGYAVPEWSFDGLRPRKPKLGSIRQQQFKPAPEDIAPIFKSPIYLGSRDYQRGRKLDGLKVYHDALYFLPIMFTYLGARRKEFAGLCVDDIVEGADGYVIIIRSNELRRLKTAQSERRLPLPDEMIRLGILDYHAAIKARGYHALFPDLFSHKTDNDPGDRFYDLFTPIMKGALGENMWSRSLHALRHGMADTLKQAGVSSEVIDDLAGRTSSRSETNTRYTNAANIALMRDALSNYPIITADIKAKPLNLLPWVDDRKPAPWAKDSKKM